MRILYDHQVFSLQDTGGISRYFYELARFMGEMEGVEPEIAIGISRLAQPLDWLKDQGVRVDKIGGGLPAGMLRYACNEAYCSGKLLFRGKFDIYHPTLYRRMPFARTKRVVATSHDCIHERYPNMFSGVDKVVRAKRHLFAQADAIICVSESSRKDLLEFYNINPAKTRVIHHGVHPLARSEQAAKEIGSLMRREYILFVGSRAPYKNFNNLLRAFRDTGLHRSLDLLVVGGGKLTPEEVDLALKLQVSDSLVCLAPCRDALLAEAYAGATLFAYPSVYEGFGFPPLEAMSVGCPVLVSRSSSLPEICGDAPMYFEPGDQSSLEESLLRAIKDEDTRSRSIKRGKEVVAKYSWNQCGEQTLALYRER
ncbi:MAG: glycosyltransferase family 1 protein [Terracidiphilus sp.]